MCSDRLVARTINQSPEFDTGGTQQIASGRDQHDLSLDRPVAPEARRQIDCINALAEAEVRTFAYFSRRLVHGAKDATATVGNATQQDRGELR